MQVLYSWQRPFGFYYVLKWWIYMNEFSRTESLIGTFNLNKIKNSKVLVIGLGGVGGSAVEP